MRHINRGSKEEP
jgi:hypothetical protein